MRPVEEKTHQKLLWKSRNRIAESAKSGRGVGREEGWIRERVVGCGDCGMGNFLA